jgi:hypothetical protein
MRKHFILLGVLALGACSATDIQMAGIAVAQACAGADIAVADAKADVKGGALNTANSLGDYEASVCGSADKIAAAAQDPSTAQWVSGITQKAQALVK